MAALAFYAAASLSLLSGFSRPVVGGHGRAGDVVMAKRPMVRANAIEGRYKRAS